MDQDVVLLRLRHELFLHVRSVLVKMAAGDRGPGIRRTTRWGLAGCEGPAGLLRVRGGVCSPG
jgi:hypothetical protein